MKRNWDIFFDIQRSLLDASKNRICFLPIFTVCLYKNSSSIKERISMFKLQDDGLLNILSKIIIRVTIFALYQVASGKLYTNVKETTQSVNV